MMKIRGTYPFLSRGILQDVDTSVFHGDPIRSAVEHQMSGFDKSI